ncbi:MAG: hypothetical protein WC781_00260 [Candidatus Pacearchaeota archaeon]|jgi:hypothetical protein
MILEQIFFKDDIASKRKVIQDNLGYQAIIEDDHNFWCHCNILKKGYDDNVYQVEIGDDRGRKELHYRTLNKLIILKPHKYSPLPKIKKISDKKSNSIYKYLKKLRNSQ